jgi:hypothetical protein
MRVFALALFAFSAAAALASNLPFEYDSYQERRLWKPTPKELEAERNGQVYIYDGLEKSEVETAMAKQFERIDSMMFIRTVEPPDEFGGKPQIENDGCE